MLSAHPIPCSDGQSQVDRRCSEAVGITWAGPENAISGWPAVWLGAWTLSEPNIGVFGRLWISHVPLSCRFGTSIWGKLGTPGPTAPTRACVDVLLKCDFIVATFQLYILCVDRAIPGGGLEGCQEGLRQHTLTQAYNRGLETWLADRAETELLDLRAATGMALEIGTESAFGATK